jgi:enamine deaminase RidA (YjgF/YER057c/UK114 family)
MSPSPTNPTAEQRLRDLGFDLSHPPRPLGAYVEAVQTGSLLFLSGTLPLEGGTPKFVGRVGSELSIEDGRRATHLAALNALAAAREHLGSLDRVTRVVRLAVSLLTTPEFRQHPTVADAASELLATVFGADRTSTRLVYGAATLPLGVSAVVELILEVSL